MESDTLSQYAVCNGSQGLLKKWACSLLLDHGLYDNLVEANVLGRCNIQYLCRLLGFVPSEFDDKERLHDKLIGIQIDVRNSEHDESDPFCVNTRWIQSAIGLKEGELAVLRFFLIATANAGFREAIHFHNEEFQEATLCTFLAGFLQIPIDEVSEALASESPLKRSGLLRLPFNHGLSRNLSEWIDVEPFFANRIVCRSAEARQVLNAIYSKPEPASLSADPGPSIVSVDLKTSSPHPLDIQKPDADLMSNTTSIRGGEMDFLANNFATEKAARAEYLAMQLKLLLRLKQASNTKDSFL